MRVLPERIRELHCCTIHRAVICTRNGMQGDKQRSHTREARDTTHCDDCVTASARRVVESVSVATNRYKTRNGQNGVWNWILISFSTRPLEEAWNWILIIFSTRPLEEAAFTVWKLTSLGPHANDIICTGAQHHPEAGWCCAYVHTWPCTASCVAAAVFS